MSTRRAFFAVTALALGAGGMAAFQWWDHGDVPKDVDEPGARAVLLPAQESESSPGKGIRRPPPVDDGDPGMLRAMKRALQGYDGKIAFLGERVRGDKRFGSLEARIVRVDDEPFDHTTSEAALRAVAATGARYLLVSQLQPPIEPWLDRRATTLRRLLRDGVSPPNFHPRVIGRAHILYRVAPPLALSGSERHAITKHVRARLAGRAEDTLRIERPSDAVGPNGHRVFVRLRAPSEPRTRGRPIVTGTGRGETFAAAVDAATSDAVRLWADADRRGLPRALPEALPRIAVEIDVAHRVAEMTNREESRLFWLLEIGREGVYLERGERFYGLPPSDAVYRSLADEKTVVERVGRDHELGTDAWKKPRYRFGRFESLNWIERSPGGAVADLYRGAPLVRLRDITRERLVSSLRLGARFLVQNQNPDGQFRYLYKPFKPEGERWSNENNVVRHGLNPYTVLLVNEIEPDPSYVAAAHKGIGYTLKHLKRIGNRCHVLHLDDGLEEPNAKMGTVAVTLLSILKLKEVADISQYEDEVSCLGEQILYMQQESGDIRQYDVALTHPSYRWRNTIFPGELMFALSRLYAHTRDARYKTAFDRLRDFQVRWFAELRVEKEEDGIYDEKHRVDLISFEPWGLMALDDMHRETRDDQYVDWAYELVEFMDGTFQFNLETSQYPDYVGAYFKTQEELPAINSCGYSEGAAAAYAIAVRTGRKVEERRRALLLGLRFALQLQYYDRSLIGYIPDPATAHGGYRYNLGQSRVRNDYMYHAMSALAQGVENLRPQDYPAQTPITGVPEILRALTE